MREKHRRPSVLNRRNFAHPIAGTSQTSAIRSRLLALRPQGTLRSLARRSEQAAEEPGGGVLVARRLLVGIASASLVAVGVNFAGVTSAVLGLAPEAGRSLRLDVLYPIEGYNRVHLSSNLGGRLKVAVSSCRKSRAGQVFGSPGTQQQHQTEIFHRVAAFGPLGSTGELNVSVIVTLVSLDFAIEAFGCAKEVGETLIKKKSGCGRPGIAATLLD